MTSPLTHLQLYEHRCQDPTFLEDAQVVNCLYGLNLPTFTTQQRSSEMAQPSWYVGLTATLLAYAFSKIVFRLFFHPLARFPGPKLVAASGLYEFYWDAIRQGQYFREIDKMHRKYGKLSLHRKSLCHIANHDLSGPVVRIGPDEIHVNDPKFIPEVYAGPGNVRDKYNFYTNQFG